MPNFILPTDEITSPARDFGQLGEWAEAVGGAVLRLKIIIELRLEAGDSDLEELVEVRRADREESKSLKERSGLIAGFLEHSLVEIEPA